VFRRSSAADPFTDSSDAAAKQSGKCRPTPKRREAEAARKNKAAPPKDRKQAKQRMREEKAKERARTAAALRAGDERHYPVRDQGKARHIARNWVDGRRNVGELFWPLVITALIFLLVPVQQLQALSTVLLLGFYFFVMGDTAWSLLGLRGYCWRCQPPRRIAGVPAGASERATAAAAARARRAPAQASARGSRWSR